MLIADLDHLEVLARTQNINGSAAVQTVSLNIHNGSLVLSVNGQEVYKGAVPDIPIATTTAPDSSPEAPPILPVLGLGGLRLRSLLYNAAKSGGSMLSAQTAIAVS